MRTRNFFRWLFGAPLLLLATGCGSADNPYARIEHSPLVQGRLHTITLVSDTGAIVSEVEQAGLTAVALPPNYQQADAVEASLWGVPEPVAARALHFKGAPPAVDVRVLVMPLAARGRSAAASVEKAFFRNVLGNDVPQWPLPGRPSDRARIQVWTYLVGDIVAASRALRANGIPVIYDPVSITTSYFGTHRTLAIRAPDGTVVQLVEAAAQ